MKIFFNALFFIFCLSAIHTNTHGFGAKSPEPQKTIEYTPEKSQEKYQEKYQDKPKKAPEDVRTRCVCPMIYMPVCGEDNKNYSNACHANCAGIKIKSQGECQNNQ